MRDRMARAHLRLPHWPPVAPVLPTRVSNALQRRRVSCRKHWGRRLVKRWEVARAHGFEARRVHERADDVGALRLQLGLVGQVLPRAAAAGVPVRAARGGAGRR